MSRNPIPPRVPPAPGQRPVPPAPVSPGAAPAAVPPKFTPANGGGGEEIIARAATYYRMTRYAMVVLLLAAAGWFAYDGWKGWPGENERHERNVRELDLARKTGDEAKKDALTRDPFTNMKPHSQTDIDIQRRLAMGLPIAALGFLVWALFNSRGRYRLSGDTLEIPGHPPVRLDEIKEIDRHNWDRKGIAHLSYVTASGKKGRLRLDDFIYERDPTDKIFERVEAHVTGPVEPQSDA